MHEQVENDLGRELTLALHVPVFPLLHGVDVDAHVVDVAVPQLLQIGSGVGFHDIAEGVQEGGYQAVAGDVLQAVFEAG